MITAAGQPADNGVIEVVGLLVLAAVLAWVGRRRRRLRERYNPSGRQRAVLLRRQWLERLTAVLVAGGVLYKDIVAGPANLVAVIIGGLVGPVLGVVRGRLVFRDGARVRNRIVLERKWPEMLITPT